MVIKELDTLPAAQINHHGTIPSSAKAVGSIGMASGANADLEAEGGSDADEGLDLGGCGGVCYDDRGGLDADVEGGGGVGMSGVGGDGMRDEEGGEDRVERKG